MRDLEQKIEEIPLDWLAPYENNAKRHTKEQISAIENSIKEFGFRNPIIVWQNDDGRPEIVAGHARAAAAKNLRMQKVPVIYCNDLEDAQRRALTLVDNQTTMMTGWDRDLLDYELDVLAESFDMESMGFTSTEIDFSNLDELAADTDESREFEEKFKPKKTTDDCYTPPEIYEVIKDWACDEYGIDRSKIVRPFYPGGDFEKFDYSGGKVVLDNPPFSILTKICEFYLDNDVPFFLFCPTLTGFSSKRLALRTCKIICGCQIIYENGAVVNTSFITNLGGDVVAKTSPELYRLVKSKTEELKKLGKDELPKYDYPDEVLISAVMGKWSKYGVEFEVKRSDCIAISELDEMKDNGSKIFGGVCF